MCVAALVGCGKDKGLCSVEGTVTLDGVPLESGTINFGPMAGASGTATGGKNEGGKYSIKASEGEMVVTIRSQKQETETDADGRQILKREEIIPEKYNQASELKKTVSKGKNTIDFDLKSE